MAGWDWLTEHASTYSWRFVWRVIIKAALLFVLVNLIYALVQPMPLIGRLTFHNWLLPGRVRLPYGEDARAYNLSLNSLEAMFATHEVARTKADDEFRVLIVGDSATWGVLLEPDQTLAGQINALDLTHDNGDRVRAYNIGHPVLSLTKDLLLLDYAMRHQPDMIIWPVTLQSFARERQLDAALVQENAMSVRDLINRYDLDLDPQDARLHDPTLLERTLVGQRRPLADWLRLQLYGFMWAATDIDQFYPDEYELRANDFEADVRWLDYDTLQPLTADELAFDVIGAGAARAGNVPLLLVNEPIFIADGANSDLRYNFWYPLWAYDAYREVFAQQAEANGWHYIDLWDRLAPEAFTDSPVHLTPQGTQTLAEIIGAEIITR
ncbi:MAG: SGNH/GDSL hydrolase family protein [Anaerolineae bacterium]|nr:SGNH/GDSL hydrolase family protein [Anaerolineae bacterium]